MATHLPDRVWHNKMNLCLHCVPCPEKDAIPKGKSRVEKKCGVQEKTLLDLPWSNGTHHWPMAIFAHTKHTMVLHLCRLIHVFVAFRSSYRCLYRFTCAKIPNLLVIWEGTCFVSCSFVANQKDHRKMLAQKKTERHMQFSCTLHALSLALTNLLYLRIY